MVRSWKQTVLVSVLSVLPLVFTSAGHAAEPAKPRKPATAPAKPARAAAQKPVARTVVKQAPARTQAAAKPAARIRTVIKPNEDAGDRRARMAAAVANANARQGSSVQRASFAPSPHALAQAGLPPSLASATVLVQDIHSQDILVAKNEHVIVPIASITKLMTALVVVDANQALNEVIEITHEDIDTEKNTHSRLSVGTKLIRSELLQLALMSSENRAAHALGRNYPGGLTGFVQAMNAKAQLLGMHDTRYIEPTGLSSRNVSSPTDLVRLMQTAALRPLIRQYTTSTEMAVTVNNRVQQFRNTNALVKNPSWDISVSKTGFINEAGRCLVMLTSIEGRDLAIVLLDSAGTMTRTADAVRIRQWVEREIRTL
ncbi:D-alanyl-D-alanine endopeptidase [Pigmentiphaga aceris]|uniref:D-alanyl-D-alanine endopeptidase n=1 Tax=Pigmentiphaga aceris TaxID=1940612 RepID=A0A5C0AX34_9BURK|nr:D-alanyl-D-alanine endopeptidase [Pigmentiphaga aceris]QEI07032.1 D-alanyl-D-alanine endopeptidase [Pigmentiphaga aceris]